MSITQSCKYRAQIRRGGQWELSASYFKGATTGTAFLLIMLLFLKLMRGGGRQAFLQASLSVESTQHLIKTCLFFPDFMLRSIIVTEGVRREGSQSSLSSFTKAGGKMSRLTFLLVSTQKLIQQAVFILLAASAFFWQRGYVCFLQQDAFKLSSSLLLSIWCNTRGSGL